jgi:hypothetical protein
VRWDGSIVFIQGLLLGMIGVDLTVLDGVQQLAGLGVDALEGGSEGHPGVARAAPEPFARGGSEGVLAQPVVSWSDHREPRLGSVLGLGLMFNLKKREMKMNMKTKDEGLMMNGVVVGGREVEDLASALLFSFTRKK